MLLPESVASVSGCSGNVPPGVSPSLCGVETSRNGPGSTWPETGISRRYASGFVSTCARSSSSETE
jgi:hypothetical protein